jgi:hypothetical protein
LAATHETAARHASTALGGQWSATARGLGLDRRSSQRTDLQCGQHLEVTIKTGLGREDFKADPHLLRRGLLDNGYVELPITSEHTLAVSHLPHHHKDPFDRLLVAQATVEGITLLTSDPIVASYPGPIRKV